MASFAFVISLFYFRSVFIRLGRSSSDLLDKYHNLPSQFLPSASGDCASNPVFLRWICSLLGHVTRRVPACTIWSILESLFQSQSKACTMQPQLLLLQPPQQGDLSVAAYFLRLSGFTNPLVDAGNTIGVDALICYLLAVFGPNFKAMVVNLTHRSDSLNLEGVLFFVADVMVVDDLEDKTTIYPVDRCSTGSHCICPNLRTSCCAVSESLFLHHRGRLCLGGSSFYGEC